MKYCTFCADWNSWPKPEGEKSLGECGCCHRNAVLGPDVDASTLPPVKKLPKREKAGILKPNRKIIRPN